MFRLPRLAQGVGGWVGGCWEGRQVNRSGTARAALCLSAPPPFMQMSGGPHLHVAGPWPPRRTVRARSIAVAPVCGRSLKRAVATR